MDEARKPQTDGPKSEALKPDDGAGLDRIVTALALVVTVALIILWPLG